MLANKSKTTRNKHGLQKQEYKKTKTRKDQQTLMFIQNHKTRIRAWFIKVYEWIQEFVIKKPVTVDVTKSMSDGKCSPWQPCLHAAVMFPRSVKRGIRILIANNHNVCYCDLVCMIYITFFFFRFVLLAEAKE